MQFYKKIANAFGDNNDIAHDRNKTRSETTRKYMIHCKALFGAKDDESILHIHNTSPLISNICDGSRRIQSVHAGRTSKQANCHVN